MAKAYYIKERSNPQLGTYYVAKGQMTKKEAKACEKSSYGTNRMLKFDTEKEYNAAIEKFELQEKMVYS